MPMADPMVGVGAAVAATPEKPAFVDRDLTVGSADFDRASDLVANGLAARGVDAGDRIAIKLPNSVVFFKVWAAAAKLQASVVLVNTHLKSDEVGYIVWIRTQRCSSTTATRRGMVAAGEPASAGRARAGRDARAAGLLHVGDDGPAEGRRARHARRRAGDAGAAGPGRAVGLATRRRVPPRPARVPRRARAATRCPRSFVGATTVVLPRWDAREWLRLVDAHRVTLQLHDARALHPHPRGARGRSGRTYDLSSLRLIVHAAAPCPVDREAPHHRRAARRPRSGSCTARARAARPDLADGVARAARQRRHCRGPASRCASSTTTATPLRAGRDRASSTSRRRRRALPLPRRPRQDRRRRGATTRSRSATSATSTTTATSTSPTVRPTW